MCTLMLLTGNKGGGGSCEKRSDARGPGGRESRQGRGAARLCVCTLPQAAPSAECSDPAFVDHKELEVAR